MLTLKTRIQDLVANAKTEVALEQLLDIKYIEGSFREELLLLSSRSKKLQIDGIVKGILSQEAINIEKNKINDGLLILIQQLPSETSLIEYKRKSEAKQLGIAEKEVTHISQYLEERYSERLRQKMDNRLALSLKLSYTQEGMSYDYVSTFFDEESKMTSTAQNSCLDLLKWHKHLLIIGNPGAGKTTLLLELALTWLKQHEELSFPIIFNLASWNKNNTSFKTWLEDALVSGYGFSINFAKKTLNKNLILPLLDGLDEVGRFIEDEIEQQDLRAHCLKAVDSYISEENVRQFIICSRRKEFVNIQHNAPIKAEILINPFTVEQLYQNLSIQENDNLSNREINTIKKLIYVFNKGETELLKVLQIPFYFNLAFEIDSLSNSTLSIDEIPKKREDLEFFLVEKFLIKKINDSENNTSKTRKYLSWLAKYLVSENKVLFELADLQPKMLDYPRFGSFVGSSLFGAIMGFFFASIYFLYSCFKGLVIGDIKFSIAIIWIFITTYALIGVFAKKNKIITDDLTVFDWNRLKFMSSWKKIFSQITRPILYSSITGGLVVGFFYMYISGENFTFIAGFLIGFVAGFLIGGVNSLGNAIFREISIIKPFGNINTPYFRFKSGLTLGFTRLGFIFFSVILFFTLSSTLLLFIPFTFMLPVSVIAIIILLIFSIPNLIHRIPIVKHFILRIGLYLEGKLPLKCVDFFKKNVDSRILENDGGQWRFRHQILQDYFASLKD